MYFKIKTKKNTLIPQSIFLNCYILINQLKNKVTRKIPENFPVMQDTKFVCITENCFFCKFDKKNLNHINNNKVSIKFIISKLIKMIKKLIK